MREYKYIIHNEKLGFVQLSSNEALTDFPYTAFDLLFKYCINSTDIFCISIYGTVNKSQGIVFTQLLDDFSKNTCCILNLHVTHSIQMVSIQYMSNII